MSKSYSVAEARKGLPSLLDDVEQGGTAQITRRGRPVAVVIPVEEYRRVFGQKGRFSEVYQAWRDGVDPADLELPSDYFDDVRDRSPGREIEL